MVVSAGSINNIKITATQTELQLYGSVSKLTEGGVFLYGTTYIENGQALLGCYSRRGMKMQEGLISLSQMTTLRLQLMN